MSMVDGVRVLPLTHHEDERGWFLEVQRGDLLGTPVRQVNISFSRQGVIRGLHYHERGQDDLFVCVNGTARMVVLDRSSGEATSLDIGGENPVAVVIPGHHAHGFEALTDALMCYCTTREYDPHDPDEQTLAWDDSRVKALWSTRAPILSARDRTA